MKLGLVGGIVTVVLVAGALIYFTNGKEEPLPSIPSSAAILPEKAKGPAELNAPAEAAAERKAPAPLAEVPKPLPKKGEERAVVPTLAAGAIPEGSAGKDISTIQVVSSIDDLQTGAEEFEKKYESATKDEMKQAFDALDREVTAQKDGAIEGKPYARNPRLEAAQREMGWLKEHMQP